MAQGIIFKFINRAVMFQYLEFFNQLVFFSEPVSLDIPTYMNSPNCRVASLARAPNACIILVKSILYISTGI